MSKLSDRIDDAIKSEDEWFDACLQMLPDVDSEERAALRECVREVAYRKAVHAVISPQWQYAAIWSFVLCVEVAGGILGITLQSLHSSSSRSAITFVEIAFIVLINMMAIGILPYTLRLWSRWTNFDLSVPAAIQALPFTYPVFVTLMFAPGLVHQLNPSKPGGVSASDWVLVATVIVVNTGLVTALGGAQAVSAISHSSLRADYAPPTRFDFIMMRLLTVVRWIRWCEEEGRWSRRSHAVRLIRELERVARDSQRFAFDRAPLWDSESRSEARKKGIQLATLIRAHKAPLVAAIGPEDFEKVARSLTYGLFAWARHDLDAILAAAPEVRLRDWVRPVLRRLWPAVILATGGAVLPMLDVFKSSPQAAQSIRVAMFISAVVALTSGTANVSDRVNAVVDKYLPGSDGGKKEKK